MRQHRRIEQGLIARDGGGEAVRQRETRVSFQMRKEIAMRETLTVCPFLPARGAGPVLPTSSRTHATQDRAGRGGKGAVPYRKGKCSFSPP